MAESWAQDPRDNPLVCSTKEEEATTGGDQADGPSVILNQMEGPGGNRLGFPWLGSTEEWGSTDSDFWQQAESMDRVNNNQEPFEGEGFQGEELLLTPEDDLMTDVVQRLDVKMSAPYSVNHGESATVENDVEIEDASETEESLCPRDQTGNGKPEPLDDVRDANQEQEAVMGSADFKEYEKGLSSQSEQSDMDSNGERDTLEPDIQQLLEMHLSKQKLSAGRKLVNSSDSDQEGHEKEILNAANNEDDVDKTLMILDKPEILNEQECTKATTDKCMESRLPSNQTSESEVHSSDSRDHIFKLALSSELQAPTAQTLEQDMNDNLQEYHKMDLVTEELFLQR
ncbi:uncharacterized protein LOC115095801 isoform X3 [Rhinatrema bivittatum]|uniref:uncharacterized protein LOC115095801 isoform X3 n=1 Tax=Rhinatrema bivittatum TaxID=194408 RepID=UPI00112ACB94|nr:uncharacterized protein LOC115095801 isoform X3 [Rhinatrema bivittatum]